MCTCHTCDKYTSQPFCFLQRTLPDNTINRQSPEPYSLGNLIMLAQEPCVCVGGSGESKHGDPAPACPIGRGQCPRHCVGLLNFTLALCCVIKSVVVRLLSDWLRPCSIGVCVCVCVCVCARVIVCNTLWKMNMWKLSRVFPEPVLTFKRWTNRRHHLFPPPHRTRA